MNNYLFLFSFPLVLSLTGCSKTDCEGSKLYLAEDGRCYYLERNAASETTETTEATETTELGWLSDEAVTAGVQDRFRRNRGTAAADFDGDGHVDFYLANPDDPSTLLLNTGGGIFEEQELAPTTGNDGAVAAADYDNDGDVDLWVTCGGWGAACMDGLFRNDGVDPSSGRVVFTDVSAVAGLSTEPRQGFGAAWGDCDNDGYLDVYVTNKRDWSAGIASSANQLYLNNGDGTFEEVGETAGVALEGDNHIATWIDVEPDGDIDLFVPTLFGDNVLYLNDGQGSFTEAGASEMTVPYQAFGSSASDFNNDGLVDLLVTATSGSGWAPEDRGDEPVLFINQGGGDFLPTGLSDLLSLDAPLQMRVMGFAIGDLNMDGYTDLFFGNGEPIIGGYNRLIMSSQEGGARPSYIDASSVIDYEAPHDDGDEPYRAYPYRTHGTVMVDVDADLDVDLFVGNGGMNQIPDKEEPNRLFISTKSETSNIVSVTLQGVQSNRDGVGAMIVVSGEDEEDTVYRWVVRSSGFNSSVPREQLIGLGTRAGPYRVEVAWPSGVTQAVEGVNSGARLTIVEAAQ